MSDPSLSFLLVKMLTTAAIVVTASMVAERSGPLIAAMVATLPISAGPVYVFLALEHSDAFISEAALGSMAANTATAAFAVVYVFAAPRFGTMASLALAFSAHAPTIVISRLTQPGLAVLLLVLVIVFPLAHMLVRPSLAERSKEKPAKGRNVIALRALFVSGLVATITTISHLIGGNWTGLFATFPIVLSSLIIFLQPKIGGKAVAAVIGSGLLGLMGFGFALALVHVTAEPLGRWTALSLGLAVCLLWNLGLIAFARKT